MTAYGDIDGRVTVSVYNNENNERRITINLSGLPGWVLGMIRDSAPFKPGGSTYHCDRLDKSGPSNVSLVGSMVFVTSEPAPIVVPKSDDPRTDTSRVDGKESNG